METGYDLIAVKKKFHFVKTWHCVNTVHIVVSLNIADTLISLFPLV